MLLVYNIAALDQDLAALVTISLPANLPGKALEGVPLVLGPCYPRGKPRWSFWLLALATCEVSQQMEDPLAVSLMHCLCSLSKKYIS